MKKIMFILVAVCVVAIYASVFRMGNTENKNEVQIGAVLSLSGSTSSFYGEYNKHAMDLAVQEYNNSVGVDGKRVSVLYEDSRGDKTEGVNAFNKLKQSNVPLVITDISPVSVGVAPFAQNSGTVLLATSASNPTISSMGDYVFRTKMAAQHEGVKAAEYIATVIRPRSVSFLYQNSDYGIGVFDSFKKVVNSGGISVVSSEKFEKGAVDMRTELTKISRQNPDLVILAGFPKEIGQILKQSAELGLQLNFFAHSGSIGPDIDTIAGKSADGLIYLSELHTDTAEFKDFSEKYMRSYGVVPELFAASAYDATRIALNAISKCGTDKVCIRDHVANIKGYKGVSGNITFNPDGDITDRELICMKKEYKGGVLASVVCP